MGVRFTQVARLTLGACAAMWLAGSVAQAFTFQGSSPNDYSVPQFNLEEQAKQFRKDGSGDTSNKFSTPFGDGKLQFGVQQNGQPSSRFAPGFSPTPGHPSNNAHFERMLTPENFR